MAHRRVAVLELIQKHIRTRDMLELSNDIALLISQWALPHAQFRSLMFYIAECGTTSDVEQFLHNIDQKITDYREDAMKIAEVLRQQGRQEGKQEGMQKGIQEGILIGEQRGEQKGEQKGEQNAAMKIARQLITCGIERSVVKHSTGLTDQALDSLMDLQ
jgi:predicted transposase YdaD